VSIQLSGPTPSRSNTFLTNVNGVGKGQYDDLRIIQQIRFDLKRKYFRPKVWDPGVSVKEFMNLPDSLRTVCLEPEDLSINFENIDSLTRRALSGVTNIVKIVRAGAAPMLDTIFSNTNGKFTVAGINAGDRLYILSRLQPNYLDNNTKISNADAVAILDGSPVERIIPLKPKELDLIFRTVEDNTQRLVDQANLVVTIDGKRSDDYTSSGNGEFKIKAFYSSIISIRAEKPGYTPNDTKISNKAMKILQTLPQQDRDIPLNIIPCAVESNSNLSQNHYLNEYPMGQASGVFNFSYYTDSAADQINVYNGPKDQKGPRNLIFSFNEATGSNTYTQRITFNNMVITVEVIGSSKWKYTVECP